MNARRRLAWLVLASACANPAAVPAAPFADLAGHWVATRYVTTDPETWQTVEWFSAGRLTALTIDVTGDGATTITIVLPSRTLPVTLRGALARETGGITFSTADGSLDGTARAAGGEMVVEVPAVTVNSEAYGLVMRLQKAGS